MSRTRREARGKEEDMTPVEVYDEVMGEYRDESLEVVDIALEKAKIAEVMIKEEIQQAIDEARSRGSLVEQGRYNSMHTEKRASYVRIMALRRLKTQKKEEKVTRQQRDTLLERSQATPMERLFFHSAQETLPHDVFESIKREAARKRQDAYEWAKPEGVKP